MQTDSLPTADINKKCSVQSSAKTGCLRQWSRPQSPITSPTKLWQAVKELGLEGKVTHKQVSKKWENLKNATRTLSVLTTRPP
uniref:Uncharacterized protein n=1 Tax=Knipowitschia caucasica TaxID=637954 RepID=A0AAV2J008_KNICA